MQMNELSFLFVRSRQRLICSDVTQLASLLFSAFQRICLPICKMLSRQEPVAQASMVCADRRSRLFHSPSQHHRDSGWKRKSHLVAIWYQKCKVHHHEVIFTLRFACSARACCVQLSQGQVPLSALLAAIIAVAFAQQAPDCVSIARQVPEDISKYYHRHESDCNKYYQCAEYGLVLKHCPEDLHFG